MHKTLRIVLAQLNLNPGDVLGNLQKHKQAAAIALQKFHADVIVFPELGLTSYAADLFLHSEFLQSSQTALHHLMTYAPNLYSLIGHPAGLFPDNLHNACSLVHQGHRIHCFTQFYFPQQHHAILSQEYQYFRPDKQATATYSMIQDIPITVFIGALPCASEELSALLPSSWPNGSPPRLIFVLQASPFSQDHPEKRYHFYKEYALKYRQPIIYVNPVGGQEAYLFDGGSMVINADGTLASCARFFEETLHVIEATIEDNHARIHFIADHALPSLSHPSPSRQLDAPIPPPAPEVKSLPLARSAPFLQRIYHALVLSIRDYVNKNNFPGVLVGLSGGIDSALTLALAVDALGKDRVWACMLPSVHTSAVSCKEASNMASKCGVTFHSLPITPVLQAYLTALQPMGITNIGIPYENLQARCRATLLMALSNQYGYLVLNTGNYSELSVGYCTLYGDMVGGFGPLKDIPKRLVYELAKFRNQESEIIPSLIIEREPTAELADNQKDTDTLPPYSTLDAIVEGYLRQEKSQEAMSSLGLPAVHNTIYRIHRNEYKRRQGAVGPLLAPSKRYPLLYSGSLPLFNEQEEK